MNIGGFLKWGTPKSSISTGCSSINHPFWGTPIYGNLYSKNIIQSHRGNPRCDGWETLPCSNWIGSRENLQETLVFIPQGPRFSCSFCCKPIWNINLGCNCSWIWVVFLRKRSFAAPPVPIGCPQMVDLSATHGNFNGESDDRSVRPWHLESLFEDKSHIYRMYTYVYCMSGMYCRDMCWHEFLCSRRWRCVLFCDTCIYATKCIVM